MIEGIENHPYKAHLPPAMTPMWKKIEAAKLNFDKVRGQFGPSDLRTLNAMEDVFDALTEPAFVAWQWDTWRKASLKGQALPVPFQAPRMGKLIRHLLAVLDDTMKEYSMETPEFQSAYKAYLAAFNARKKIGELTTQNRALRISKNPITR